jgi:insulysin
VIFRLYSDLVNDSLTEFAYDAEVAGLTYNVVAVSTGLWISLSGYNDKMAVLSRHVVQKVKDLIVDPERLEVMKEQACLPMPLLANALTRSF